MSDMQAFYQSLISKPTDHDAYRRWLARLTQATRDQIVPLRSEMAWTEWEAQASGR